MFFAKKTAQDAAGALQDCTVQDTGAEAGIQTMYHLFQDDEMEPVLLIYAENVFNSVNSEVMLHNISIVSPIFSTFISKCYCVPVRLFVIGNKKMISREDTTQGYPTAIGLLGVTPLFHFLQEFIIVNNQTSKKVTFASNFTVTRKVDKIKSN